MRDHPAGHPWSVPVRIDEVPEGGRHFDLIADEGTRAAVAELAGLRSLTQLAASLDLIRRGRNDLRVVGHVSATVGQVCVVSLEPMEQDVEETIDVTFSPQASATAPETAAEIEIPPEDGPEPLIEGKIDLGALATEFLILGIDPYPRKPEAKFEPPPAADDTGHPFSALAALKKHDGEQ
jgi:uncharacterized metal-binding protein YceD (DUF177 family)